MATFKNLSLAALLAVSPLAFGEPVDINTADAATLAKELNGVGEAKAQAIVAYREQHGPFQSVEELAMV
ncbi:MAG: helix-hairpin-helix domain-containing protein, partial [Gammaproteobacteria bacterium]|nr:helix-hairpin-helix domain-containing protein [Gammaproteobacteria bacterium]